MKQLRLAGFFVLVLIISTSLFALQADAEPTFPELTGRVVDNAQLLSPEQEAALVEKLRLTEEKTSAQFVIVTLPSLQGINIREYGYRLGRHWGIGQKNKDNGVLLIIAPIERKVAIEVGYGLEPVITDALAKLIIEHKIIPYFRQGDFGGGIAAGAHDITLLLASDENAEKLKKDYSARERASDEEALSPFAVFILIVVLLIILNNMNGGGGRGIILGGPGMGRSSRRGGWSGGGGGFSGGGGSFGGGGASGGW